MAIRIRSRFCQGHSDNKSIFKSLAQLSFLKHAEQQEVTFNNHATAEEEGEEVTPEVQQIPDN